MVRWLIGFLSLLAVVFTVPTAAQAHKFNTSRAFVFVDQEITYFHVLIGVNLEAILAEIDPIYEDTNDSPNAPIYDRLRELPPDELEAMFDEIREEFLSELRFEVDGQRLDFEVVEEIFREVGDLESPRSTSFKILGQIPPGAETFTFGWAYRFGQLTLATISDRSRLTHVEVLKPGVTSEPLAFQDIRSRSGYEMVWNFLVIGFDHIVPKGLDHILFVVGIFLLSTKLRPILVQVTSFTVAHTITLGLGMAGFVNLPPGIVEPLIALSIVYVAVENIMTSDLSRWRPILVFAFGLLHGLGFAGALREFDIPTGDFLLGLLSFNIGVELGQLTVIAICFLVAGAWFGNKSWYRAAIVIPGSLAIGLVGAFWFLERTGILA